MSVKFNKAKPFSKILISVFLLAIVYIAARFAVINQSTERIIDLYATFGKFICEYDIILISIILGVNLLELIDYFVNSKRDEAINANYEYLMGHIGFLTFFKQYFAPMFAKGPYIFATEDKNFSFIRKLVNFIVGIVKFAFWLIMILLFIAMASKQEVKDTVINGNKDYIFTALVLFACINCNIFIYVLYKISPLYSSRTYKVVTYYSDGSVTAETKSQSNFVAMLILSAFIYIYFSVFYFSCMSTKLKRIIETDRFCRFLKKCGDNESILAFYREK